MMSMTKIYHWISIFLLIGLWIYVLVQYNSLSDSIPTHFNLKGEVDSYGAKWTIIAVPVIATLLYLLLHFTSKDKSKLNYPIKITDTNKAKAYAITEEFIAIIKLMLVVIFSTSAYVTCQTAQGNMLSSGIVLIEAGLLFLFVFVYIFRLTSIGK
jgi:uncharacterized membrane protein